MRAYIICISFFIVYVVTSSPKEYGDFNLDVISFQQCQGPKRKDCSKASCVLLNSKVVRIDLNMLENMSPTNTAAQTSVMSMLLTLDSSLPKFEGSNHVGKIVAITNGKPFLRLQMKKPCDHLFLRPLFHTLMNLTKECVILKGRYLFNVDIEEIASKYYGGMFLFGNFTFKSVFYNNNCNLYCSHLDVSFTPKNKTYQ